MRAATTADTEPGKWSEARQSRHMVITAGTKSRHIVRSAHGRRRGRVKRRGSAAAESSQASEAAPQECAHRRVSSAGALPQHQRSCPWRRVAAHACCRRVITTGVRRRRPKNALVDTCQAARERCRRVITGAVSRRAKHGGTAREQLQTEPPGRHQNGVAVFWHRVLVPKQRVCNGVCDSVRSAALAVPQREATTSCGAGPWTWAAAAHRRRPAVAAAAAGLAAARCSPARRARRSRGLRRRRHSARSPRASLVLQWLPPGLAAAQRLSPPAPQRYLFWPRASVVLLLLPPDLAGARALAVEQAETSHPPSRNQKQLNVQGGHT